MSETQDISTLMAHMGACARAAATELAVTPSDRKNKALCSAADAVWARRAAILEANARDVEAAREKGLSAAMIDRLVLDEDRIRAIVDGLRAVADLPDPVGEVLAEWDRPSGLHIQRVRTPLGVIGVIYESRPNVTADAGALCLKASNAVILRGGSESFHSSRAIHACLKQGLREAGLPEEAIQLVPTRDRAAVQEMLTMTDSIDVIIPRGGKALVELVQREARVPVLSHLEGIVHIYVDAAANAEKAMRVVLNAKTRRTGICGAVECLLIHRDLVGGLGSDLIRALIKAGVEVRADETLAAIEGTVAASASDWGHEYLDNVIAAKVVGDLGLAIGHIAEYGSHHTDCIITEDPAAAKTFMTQVDSAIVMQNASTQFADGGEFGMGAEIGIATGKLHARGPVGVAQLTSFKYLVTGEGAVRV